MSFDNLSNELLLVDFDTHLEVGNFEYLPRKFLNIETSKFGDTKDNPFLKLKDTLLTDTDLTFEEKCQAVRYMCHIPYLNAIDHLLECCKSILANEDYPLDKRFFFFANNEKYYKLEDNLVFKLYEFFFELCITKEYPYFFTLMCSKYLLCNYDRRTESYINARQFLYTLSNEDNEVLEMRYEAIDTLLEYGEANDKIYARDILEKIGADYESSEYRNIYEYNQNVHNSTISNSVRKILRNLIKDDFKIKNKYPVQLEDIHKYIIDSCKTEEDKIKAATYITILNRILLDPSKFEGKNLLDILIIVWRRIQTFECDIKCELYKRFFEELDDMKETCSSGHLSRIINVLSGYISEEEYELRVDPKDSLKSSIFARLNAELRKLPIAQQEEVILAMSNNDKTDEFSKMAVEEFITYYNPYDELKIEYVTGYKPLLEIGIFEEIYANTIKEYIGY